MLERRWTEEAGEHPRPAGEAPQAWGARRRGSEGGCRRPGRKVSLIVNFPQRSVCQWRVLVGLGAGEACRGVDGVVRPPPSLAAAWAPLQGLGLWAGLSGTLPAAAPIPKQKKGKRVLVGGGGGQTLGTGLAGLWELCPGRGDGVREEPGRTQGA